MTLDTSVLQNLRADVGDEFLPVILDAFHRNMAPMLDELKASAAAADGVRLQRAAHGLKSLTATIGALALSATCARLEAHGASWPVETIAQAVAEVESGIRRAVQELEQWYRTGPAPAPSPGSGQGEDVRRS